MSKDVSKSKKQKRWKVELHSTVNCYAELEVDADDKDEAKEKALDKSDSARWSYDCSTPSGCDVETGDVEEVEDEP